MKPWEISPVAGAGGVNRQSLSNPARRGSKKWIPPSARPRSRGFSLARPLARSLAKQSSHLVAAAAAAAVAVNVAVVVAAAILVVVFVVAVLILAKKERVLKNIEYYCIDEFPLQELAG